MQFKFHLNFVIQWHETLSIIEWANKLFGTDNHAHITLDFVENVGTSFHWKFDLIWKFVLDFIFNSNICPIPREYKFKCCNQINLCTHLRNDIVCAFGVRINYILFEWKLYEFWRTRWRLLILLLLLARFWWITDA